MRRALTTGKGESIERDGAPPGSARTSSVDPVWLAYYGAVCASAPLWLAYGAWRFLGRRSRTGWAERLGFGPRLGPYPHARVWFHGVSVGEVQSLTPVVEHLRELRPDVEIVVSAGTDAGRERATRIFPGARQVRYAPVDLPWSVSQAFRSVRPDLVVLSESELWPSLLRRAHRAGGAVLVNGRISDRTFRRAQRVQGLYGWLLDHLAVAGMQTPVDRDRICALGMDAARVRLLGNTKFDREAPALDPDARARWREELGLKEAPVLVAGSTFPGEERILASALLQVRGSHPDARMIVAPRHTSRAHEVLDLFTARGLRGALRSRVESASDPDVVVVDTAGELASLYGLGEVAFVGRSLTRGGGQNPIEPMGMGVPLLHGPRMESFRGVIEEADLEGAARAVADTTELAQAWKELLDEPDLRRHMGAAGRRIVESNRGSAQRTARLVADALEAGDRPAPT